MHLTPDQRVFLNIIKPECMRKCKMENIAPSLIASLAVIQSECGTSNFSLTTNNLFSLLVDDNWFGSCYSKRSKRIYRSKKDCIEPGAVLYKVYDFSTKSIDDFIDYLVNARRSKNGPYKYESLKYCLDYKESVNRLMRAGFMKDYLNQNEDPNYAQQLITISEEYGLYKWNDELKSPEIKEEEHV